MARTLFVVILGTGALAAPLLMSCGHAGPAGEATGTGSRVSSTASGGSGAAPASSGTTGTGGAKACVGTTCACQGSDYVQVPQLPMVCAGDGGACGPIPCPEDGGAPDCTVCESRTIPCVCALLAGASVVNCFITVDVCAN
jgi:hypothetical protein